MVILEKNIVATVFQAAFAVFEGYNIIFLFAGKISLLQNDLIINGTEKFCEKNSEFFMFIW